MTEAVKVTQVDNEWQIVADVKPPVHIQVLVELREGIGTVCDVACYNGRQEDGEDRWTLADVRLDSRQIKRWAHIYPKPPANELGAARIAAATRMRERAAECAVEASWDRFSVSGRAGVSGEIVAAIRNLPTEDDA